MTWLRKFTSEPVVFLHAVAYMINLSVLPQLVVNKVCLRHHQNATVSSDVCGSGNEVEPEISDEAASWWFIIVISSQIPAVFTVLIWGPVSDVIGRQKAVIVVPIVNILQNTVFVLCSHYMDWHPAIICVGMFLSCFYGEFPGVIALCCGFIADVTATKSPETRMTRMALIDCAINFAGVPAGLFAGQLLQRVGFAAVFGLSIGLNGILLFYIVVILPTNMKYLATTDKESSTPENNENSRQNNENSRQNNENSRQIDYDLFKPHKQLKHVYGVITDKETRRFLLPLLGIFAFCIYAFVGELTTTAIFLKGKPLSLSPDFIGYYYANQALIRSIGVVLTTQIAKRVFRSTEINILLFGLTSQIACYALIGVSSSTLMVFLANLAGFAVPVPMSLLRSYTSTKVAPENVGTMMAALEALDALSYILNLISLQIYKITLDKFAGAVFVFLSSCSMAAFLLTLLNKCYLKRLASKDEGDVEMRIPSSDGVKGLPAKHNATIIENNNISSA